MDCGGLRIVPGEEVHDDDVADLEVGCDLLHRFEYRAVNRASLEVAVLVRPRNEHQASISALRLCRREWDEDRNLVLSAVEIRHVLVDRDGIAPVLVLDQNPIHVQRDIRAKQRTDQRHDGGIRVHLADWRRQRAEQKTRIPFERRRCEVLSQRMPGVLESGGGHIVQKVRQDHDALVLVLLLIELGARPDRRLECHCRNLSSVVAGCQPHESTPVTPSVTDASVEH